jgi:DNA-binding SARP family transcriptional activator
MIHFHTLGVLDLRDHQGHELRSVLQQPKRLGVLAYLVIASPRRFHRRDSLLALFWPDLDQDHARAALRRALYFLRAELGAEVIAGRGDDEIGVTEDTLWCDAPALDRALEEGAPERALALYRGPLLDGLYVSGASPEYQEWLDRERGRLRSRAATAAKTLAARAESEGRLEDAAGWARRMLELAPDDEAALRGLVSLLDQSGDRAGAVQAYEEFARRLAQEYELEPSSETRAAVDAIRSRTAAGETGPTPVAAPTTIAVLPFAIRGDPRFAYLGQGMVDLLATKLDGAGEVRTVDPRALLHFVQRETGTQPGALGPEDGRAVARHFGAGRYLLGAIVEAGGRLEASASLYATAGAPIARVRATAASEAEVFELVDELALQLLGAQRVGASTRLGRLAALTTHSLDALKAYLTGERALRDGRYFDALERFQAAVRADGSFALAYYRSAAAAAGCALVDLARTMADRGYEHRERLSPHDHLVLRAQRAWLHGAVADAESLYNSITGTYPDDVEAWFHLGDLLFHSNPLRGRSAVEAREPFERVVRLERDHVGAMTHLVRISAIEGRREEMFALIERILRASPEGDQALAMRALRAYAGDDPAPMAAIAGELQRARAITVAVAFADVALYAGNLAGAERLARSFIQVARSPELRALCHVQLAHLALARGQQQAAQEELEHAGSLDATWGLEVRALFAALPFVPATAAELERLRDELARWDAASVPPSMFLVFAMHNGLHPAIRHYLLGILEARLGRSAAAAEQAAALEPMAEMGALVRSFAVELRARIAQVEGRIEEGIALLERSRPELWFQLTVASPFFSLASRRYLHAELLREAGRMEEAAGWYAAIAQRSPYELIYAAPASQRLAEMAASRGDQAAAERHRRRVSELLSP